MASLTLHAAPPKPHTAGCASDDFMMLCRSTAQAPTSAHEGQLGFLSQRTPVNLKCARPCSLKPLSCHPRRAPDATHWSPGGRRGFSYIHLAKRGGDGIEIDHSPAFAWTSDIHRGYTGWAPARVRSTCRTSCRSWCPMAPPRRPAFAAESPSRQRRRPSGRPRGRTCPPCCASTAGASARRASGCWI